MRRNSNFGSRSRHRCKIAVMRTAEQNQVIKAIGELGRRVTPADVATKTGLPILIVQQELNRVASDTKGHLAVSNTGDIVYQFAPGFSNAYLAKGIQAAFLLVTGKILAALYYLVRISFGIALIVSLIIVIVLILVILFAMMMRAAGGDNRDRDSGFDFGFGRGFHFTFWDWMILRDLLWWNTGPVYSPTRYDYSQPTVRQRSRSSFLLNCFSFLFGDGDPNEGLEEKRWQLIAQVIKKNHNVLTAEQLAPYTGADPKDEDAVLPTLVRFNGRPEVTPSGNIVYVFESMQTTAADQNVNPPAYLQEFNWKFTNVPDGELLPVYLVAGFNLAGAYVVWNFFTNHLNMTSVASLHGLMVLVNCLLVYAIAFVTVPTVRVIINAFRNKAIDKRNVDRFRYGQIVQHPSPEVAKKITEAQDYRISSRKLTDKDVVFTTEKDARDQDDELSDQFKELEKKKPQQDAQKDHPSSKQAQEDYDVDDEGRIINLKKPAEEFDASP